jgi:thiol-disulfide isomerase/thioredoxin
MKMKLLLLIALFFLINGSLLAQAGYKIEFNIEGLKDTTVYLGFYLGEQTYRKDTAQVNSRGYFFFDGVEPLPQGIYFLILKNALQFQFIVGEDQLFVLTTKRKDYNGNMQVSGDEDNRIYFENLVFGAANFKEAEPFIKILKDSLSTKEAKKEAGEKYRTIADRVIAHQNELADKHPRFISSRWLNASRKIEIPDPPTKENGTIDSAFQWRYYRAHYFDYFDLSDEALLRMPQSVYATKIKDYLDRLIPQHPDTLFLEINKLAAQSKKNQEAYKWLVWTCVTHYQTHSIMGLDEVYVKLYDKYIATGEMDYWLDRKAKQNIKEYVDKVRLSLIGNTAPNLIMQDQHLKPRSMYDIKSKYTVLFFFRPSCGHCREEVPKLVEFYNKNKKALDVEVFAVDTDTSLQEMKKYITEVKAGWITVNAPRTYVGHFSKFYHADLTPTIYVIDEKRKIIAKKLNVDQLEDFLTRYTRQTARTKG